MNIITDILARCITAKFAKELYLSTITCSLNQDDEQLVEKVFKLAKARCQDGKHHTASVARGCSGKIYKEIQINTSRGREFSSCAETGILHNSLLEQDELEVIVTARFKPNDKGQPFVPPAIVPPCGGCRERLRRHARECLVIIEEEGSRFKVPVNELLLLGYPTSN